MGPCAKRKYLLGSRLVLLLLTLLASPSLTKAMEYGMSSQTPIVDSLVHDISYDYKLESDGNNIRCKGKLRFSISAPDKISRLRLYCSPFLLNDEVKFLSIQEYPISTTIIERDNVNWNNQFRLCVIFEDKTYIYSPIYTISDYIDEEDLVLLNQQSSVEDVDVKDVKIHAENGILNVETAENIVLSIYDLFGNCLFSGDIIGTHSIPLKNLSTPFIIVRYSDYVSTTTKKILVR